MNLDQQVREKYYDRIDIAQLAVSILVFFLSFIWIGLTSLAALTAFGQVATDYGTTVAFEPGMLIGLALTGLVFLIIALVSIVTTIQKITGQAKILKPAEEKAIIWSSAGFLRVLGLAALAGLASAEIKTIVLAILAVPGIAIPVFWLLRVGSRD